MNSVRWEKEADGAMSNPGLKFAWRSDLEGTEETMQATYQ